MAAVPLDPNVTQAFWVEEVASGLNVPWSMVWLPNGDMLILEKFGGLRVVHDGKLDPKVITAGVPTDVYELGPNGLLDLALDPDYGKNQRVFITYNQGTEALSHPTLYRARFTGDALVDGKVIFQQTPPSLLAPHPGLGRIIFLPDKTLLVASGVDDQRRFMAQKLDNDLGKILRLDRDGKPPKDNPFIGQRNALPEIYAYGIRNAIGLYRDPTTGIVWENENAMRGGDELNVIKPGANLGWPIVSHGTEYSGAQFTRLREAPGIQGPIAYWDPSIAPSGLTVVTSDLYPLWRGNVFLGALSGQHLRRVVVQEGKAVDQEVLLKDLDERIRDVRQGPDGYLYILTDNVNGRLLRLQPGAQSPEHPGLVAKKLAKHSNPTVDTLDLRPKPVDAVRGERLFAQSCAQCHTVEPGASVRVGPNLAGVLGRPAAMGNYPYSPAMRAANVVWRKDALDRFLAGPKDFVPDTAMGAAPIEGIQDRADIIAYLDKCCSGQAAATAQQAADAQH
jgi:glucose/arabinose dehydrogenase/cytochrome c2